LPTARVYINIFKNVGLIIISYVGGLKNLIINIGFLILTGIKTDLYGIISSMRGEW